MCGREGWTVVRCSWVAPASHCIPVAQCDAALLPGDPSLSWSSLPALFGLKPNISLGEGLITNQLLDSKQKNYD